MRGLDTLTHTQDDYSNPRCACALRMRKTRPRIMSANEKQQLTNRLSLNTSYKYIPLTTFYLAVATFYLWAHTYISLSTRSSLILHTVVE